MKNVPTFALLSLVSLAAYPLPLSDGHAELASCTTLRADAERLACYDRTVRAFLEAYKRAAESRTRTETAITTQVGRF